MVFDFRKKKIQLTFYCLKAKNDKNNDGRTTAQKMKFYEDLVTFSFFVQ